MAAASVAVPVSDTCCAEFVGFGVTATALTTGGVRSMTNSAATVAPQLPGGVLAARESGAGRQPVGSRLMSGIGAYAFSVALLYRPSRGEREARAVGACAVDFALDTQDVGRNRAARRLADRDVDAHAGCSG